MAPNEAHIVHIEQLEKLDGSIRNWRVGAFALVVGGVALFLLGLNSTVLEGGEAYMVCGAISMVGGFAMFPLLAAARAWHARQVVDAWDAAPDAPNVRGGRPARVDTAGDGVAT